MVQRPADFSVFEFVVLSGLRAAQLMRGCTPRVESTHKLIMTAQMEVAEGKVVRSADSGIPLAALASIDETPQVVSSL